LLLLLLLLLRSVPLRHAGLHVNRPILLTYCSRLAAAAELACLLPCVIIIRCCFICCCLFQLDIHGASAGVMTADDFHNSLERTH
jgi:hypothetical protein